MFHPERLTGKRRRKYLASIDYAPQFEKIPKHLLKVIRAPAHHVKYVKMVMPKVLGARMAHHVAVIRKRVVMLNHTKAILAGEQAMAELAGVKNWRCTCFDVLDMYATHTSTSPVKDKKRKRTRAHSSARDDLPDDMIALRLKCRTPRKAHRTTYLNKTYGFNSVVGDESSAPYVGPKTQLAKYIEAKIPNKIRERAAGVLAAALGNACRVTVNWHSTDTAAGDCQLNVRTGELGPSWTVFLDPYAWYSRIYCNGLQVLGDWFITNATRRFGNLAQQDGIDLLARSYNKTPAELGVCQPAAAVSLTWLRRPSPYPEGRAVDTVAGVIARPFPGAAWFLPLPKWGSDGMMPRTQHHYETYKFNLNKSLTKTPSVAELREEAAEYAAKLSMYAPQKQRETHENPVDEIIYFSNDPEDVPG